MENARLREISLALVRHLHGFVREVRLSEREFQQGADPRCTMGRARPRANLLGPFWRDDQPISASGDTLVRSPTPGPALFVSVALQDISGNPISGAEVDVWHSSPRGL